MCLIYLIPLNLSASLQEESRTALRESNPNLGNLVAEIWPCNNYYVSVCEDAAHGFTKGEEKVQ